MFIPNYIICMWYLLYLYLFLLFLSHIFLFCTQSRTGCSCQAPSSLWYNFSWLLGSIFPSKWMEQSTSASYDQSRNVNCGCRYRSRYWCIDIAYTWTQIKDNDFIMAAITCNPITDTDIILIIKNWIVHQAALLL